MQSATRPGFTLSMWWSGEERQQRSASAPQQDRLRKSVVLFVVSMLAGLPVPSSPAAEDRQAPVTAVAVSPGGDVVVTGSQAGVAIRSWPNLQVLRKLPTRLLNVNDVAFSPSGELLAVAGGEPAQGGTVEFYKWPSGEPIGRRTDHDDLVYDIDFSPTGHVWASASADKTVRIYDGATGECVHVLKGHSRAVRAVRFLADGRTIVSAGLDHTLRVWDRKSGRTLRVLDQHTAPVHDLARLRREGAENRLPMLVSVSDDRTVRLWQPTIGRMMRFARLEDARPLCVAVSTNNQSVFVGGSDGRLYLVDLVTVKVEHRWDVLDGWIYAVAVHPRTGDVIVCGEDGSVKRVAAR